MPLTAKGEKILSHMREEYGSEKKAEEVLYALKNSGKITGIDAMVEACDSLERRIDALLEK